MKKSYWHISSIIIAIENLIRHHILDLINACWPFAFMDGAPSTSICFNSAAYLLNVSLGLIFLAANSINTMFSDLPQPFLIVAKTSAKVVWRVGSFAEDHTCLALPFRNNGKVVSCSSNFHFEIAAFNWNSWMNFQCYHDRRKLKCFRMLTKT